MGCFISLLINFPNFPTKVASQVFHGLGNAFLHWICWVIISIKKRKTIRGTHIMGWNHFWRIIFIIMSLHFFKVNKYRIVVSNNTCYYSENQIFCFLKSQILTSLRYYSYLTNTWCVCQVAGISKRSNDKQKSFVPKKKYRHVIIQDFKKQKIWFSE